MPRLLSFTGDLFLGKDPSVSSFRGVSAALGSSVDLVVNFEGTLHASSADLRPTRRKILLTSPTATAAALQALPGRMFVVNNNHIGDYGDAVAQHTINELRRLGPTFGAGRADEEFHLTSLVINDVPVGMAAYCTEQTSPLFASPERIGPRDLTVSQVDSDIATLRGRSQHLVAIVHWGDEYHHYPTRQQCQWGRQLIDAGFDLVIGSHSHSVQGHEVYRGRSIFYSLGNFYFPDYQEEIGGLAHDLRWMSRCRWGIVPVFGVDHRRLALEALFYAVRGRDNCVRLLASSPGLNRRFKRFSSAVSSNETPRVCDRRRRYEAPLIRFGEFSVKDRKLAVVFDKAARVLGVR